MRIAVLSASLNPESRSRRLAEEAKALLQQAEGVEVDWIDLQELELPLCDGGAAYGHPNAVALGERFAAADAYVFATPIYNFSQNAALKNVVELAGRKMENKLAGFLCSAGGAMSYMSLMQLANSLMLDFRVLILPRFVYASTGDWEGTVVNGSIQKRLRQFTDDLVALGRKLAS